MKVKVFLMLFKEEAGRTVSHSTLFLARMCDLLICNELANVILLLSLKFLV